MTKQRSKRRQPETPHICTLLIHPTAYRELKQLPGHVRQRARRAIDGLATDPKRSGSSRLEQDVSPREVRRLRLDKWRVLYALDEKWKEVAIISIRQRPPYQYQDLGELLRGLEEGA